MKKEYVAMIEFDGKDSLESRIKQTEKSLSSSAFRTRMYATSWQGGMPTGTVDVGPYEGDGAGTEYFISLGFRITDYVQKRGTDDLDRIFASLDRSLKKVSSARAVTVHRITATDVPQSKEIFTEYSPMAVFQEKLKRIAKTRTYIY